MNDFHCYDPLRQFVLRFDGSFAQVFDLLVLVKLVCKSLCLHDLVHHTFTVSLLREKEGKFLLFRQLYLYWKDHEILHSTTLILFGILSELYWLIVCKSSCKILREFLMPYAQFIEPEAELLPLNLEQTR